ncbi:MAG: hypothetical protein V4604_02535 [Bacteroidota bacterium]
MMEHVVIPDLTGQWLKHCNEKNHQEYLKQTDQSPGKLNSPELIEPIFSQFRLDYAAYYAYLFGDVTVESSIPPRVIFDSIMITNNRFGKHLGSEFPYEGYREVTGYSIESGTAEFRTVDAWIYGHYCGYKMAFRFTFMNEKRPDGSYSDRWSFKEMQLDKGYLQQE